MGIFGDILDFGVDLIGIDAERDAADRARQDQKDVNRQSYEQTEKWNQISQDNWARDFEGRVQARVKDAQEAGIHPLAALGVSGVAPAGFSMASLRAPQQRPSSRAKYARSISNLNRNIEQSMARAAIGKTEAETAKIRSETATQNLLNSQQLNKNRQELHKMQTQEIVARQQAQGKIPDIPPSHVKVRDVFTGKVEWIPNTQVGYELPELIGGIEYARGRSKGSAQHPPIGTPGYNPHSPRPRTSQRRRKYYRTRR